MSKHLKICSSFRRKLQIQAGEHSPAVDLFDEWIGAASTRDRPVTSRDGVKERVLRIIISGNLPFSFVDNIELLELLKDAYPDLPPPNRKAIVELLKSKATLSRHEMKVRLAALDSKVSLALDIWTTRTNLAFLGMSSGFWFSSQEIKSSGRRSLISCFNADQFSNYGTLH